MLQTPATKLFKHSQKNQRIYAVKLNPIDKPSSKNKPKWLSTYADIFPEELSQLPPKQELDHTIDLIPGAQSVAKRPYKISVPKAIELKDQLKQLLEQGFI